MNLFKNRPLAVFCFIFIVISCFIYGISVRAKLITAAALFALFLTLAVISVILKKRRFRTVFLSICCAVAILSIVSQLLLIDIKRERELSFEGNRTVRFLVIEETYSSKTSSEYSIRIEEIDREEVAIDSAVIYAYPAELKSGDIVYARAVVSPAGVRTLGYERNYSSDMYIQTAVYDPSDSLLVSRGNTSLDIFLNGIRGGIADYFDRVFDRDTSALARGFLFGDKSDIGGEVIRDFRRAGVSHLLAISGLHMSVIMGACELLLRRFSVKRGVRCILLSFLALSFLALTGFSMSACRSVIMLLCVYFCYLFARGNDSVTFLFVSVSLIILISPHAVEDVGLWLSALATLGIVSVYVPVSSYLHRRRKSGIVGTLRYIGEVIALALLLTFICNVFICIVVWLAFGEISAVSLISNPILSPISEAFIILIPISAIIGNIPVIGSAAVALTEFLGDTMVKICEYFSEIDGAVISLRYSFAGIIILLMTVSIAVMLVIDLKRKWLVMLPAVAACIAFAVCLTAYNFIHMGEAHSVYLANGTNEAVILTEGNSAAVIDISTGGYSFANMAIDAAGENMATEIDSYVLTHYHKNHITTLEKLFRGVMLRKVYLPEPISSEDIDIMRDIVMCAAEYDIDVYVYAEDERIDILSGAWAAFRWDDNEKTKHKALLATVGNREELLTYIGTGNGEESFDGLMQESDYIIFGHHGLGARSVEISVDSERLKRVIYASFELFEAYDVDVSEDTEISFSGEGEMVWFVLK